MKLSFFCLIFLLFLGISKAHAQQEQVILGIRAGVKSGEEAFLPHWVLHSSRPLRLGLLKPLPLNAEKTTGSTLPVEELSLQLSQENWDRIQWQNLSEELLDEEQQIALPYNQKVLSLADEKGLDIIAVLRYQDVGDRVWVLFTLFSGIDGGVIYNQRFTYQAPDLTKLTKQIKAQVQSQLFTLPINEMDPLSSQSLTVRTTPEGMYVELNDVLSGLSPLSLHGVKMSPSVLKVYELEHYQITRLRLSSEPQGIKVRVNGQDLGLTPVDFPAELAQPGSFEIEFVNQGRFQAEIQVQTIPESMPVKLNQDLLQRTPISFQRLDQNRYTLHLLPYKAIEVRVPVEFDQSLENIQIDAYKLSRLLISTSVEDAEITLDDEIVGETPFSTKLSQGLHRVQVRKNRYRSLQTEINLRAGETRQLNFEMRPRSADTSIFLTPTGELTPQLNLAAKYLTFGELTQSSETSMGHLYGLELDYGWPRLFQTGYFDWGLGLSVFGFGLNTNESWRSFQGVGSKLQFLRESDEMPISAALGAYFNIDFRRPLAVAYLSLSRNFGDFALHLGLQTHGFSINLGYTGWEDIRLGLLAYSDAFLRLLAEPGEESTTFYGLQLGYSF